jgi:hypothetical protein
MGSREGLRGLEGLRALSACVTPPKSMHQLIEELADGGADKAR